MPGETLLSFERDAWVISSGHGKLWTDRVFSTEAEARKYLANGWGPDSLPRSLQPVQACVQLSAALIAMDDRVKVASLTGWAAATVEGRVSRRIAAALIGASFERLTEAECLRTANAVTGDILSELRASDTGRSEAEAMRDACARWHEAAALEDKERARQFSPGSSRRAWALVKAEDHIASAAAIRDLPLGGAHD